MSDLVLCIGKFSVAAVVVVVVVVVVYLHDNSNINKKNAELNNFR